MTEQKTEQVHIRVTPAQKAAMLAEAEKRNQTLSAWLLGLAKRAIQKVK